MDNLIIREDPVLDRNFQVGHRIFHIDVPKKSVTCLWVIASTPDHVIALDRQFMLSLDTMSDVLFSSSFKGLLDSQWDYVSKETLVKTFTFNPTNPFFLTQADIQYLDKLIAMETQNEVVRNWHPYVKGRLDQLANQSDSWLEFWRDEHFDWEKYLDKDDLD